LSQRSLENASDVNRVSNKSPIAAEDVTTLRRAPEFVRLPQAALAPPKLAPMKPQALTPEIRMAIRVRAEVLFDLATEAESNGAPPEVVDQVLTEELEAMKANLHAIYPPERVQAIIEELLVVYDAYKRWISPDSEAAI
jgi:hypothetical protein